MLAAAWLWDGLVRRTRARHATLNSPPSSRRRRCDGFGSAFAVVVFAASLQDRLVAA